MAAQFEKSPICKLHCFAAITTERWRTRSMALRHGVDEGVPEQRRTRSVAAPCRGRSASEISGAPAIEQRSRWRTSAVSDTGARVAPPTSARLSGPSGAHPRVRRRAARRRPDADRLRPTNLVSKRARFSRNA